LAHLGVSIFIVGVVATTAYSTERDLRLGPGDSVEVGSYRFRLEGVRQVPGPNYTASRGTVTVTGVDGDESLTLYPEKRVYRVQTMPMTEAAIDAGFLRHLYVSLGDPIEGGAWSVRIYHKPFVGWIWMGTLTMALGGLLAAADRRYRLAAKRAREAMEPEHALQAKA
jgi:cytochrome c-type biogenesis protein CcmF